MTHIADKDGAPGKVGLVLHTAALYDVLVWLLTLGREPAFREKLLHFARLQPGETVLDVGCGTGSLAIAAKRQVGPAGRVYGIDASPEMIARAAKKAQKRRIEIEFRNSPAQILPFPDAQFDAVLNSSLAAQRPRGVCPRDTPAAQTRWTRPCRRFRCSGPEAWRPVRPLPSPWSCRPYRDGGFFSDAGLKIVETGPVGWRDLQFVLATVPPQDSKL